MVGPAGTIGGRAGAITSAADTLQIRLFATTIALGWVGAAAGGAFADTTSAEVLKLLLGAILIAAALKAFWRHR